MELKLGSCFFSLFLFLLCVFFIEAGIRELGKLVVSFYNCETNDVVVFN